MLGLTYSEVMEVNIVSELKSCAESRASIEASRTVTFKLDESLSEFTFYKRTKRDSKPHW